MKKPVIFFSAKICSPQREQDVGGGTKWTRAPKPNLPFQFKIKYSHHYVTDIAGLNLNFCLMLKDCKEYSVRWGFESIHKTTSCFKTTDLIQSEVFIMYATIRLTRGCCDSCYRYSRITFLWTSHKVEKGEWLPLLIFQLISILISWHVLVNVKKTCPRLLLTSCWLEWCPMKQTFLFKGTSGEITAGHSCNLDL